MITFSADQDTCMLADVGISLQDAEQLKRLAVPQLRSDRSLEGQAVAGFFRGSIAASTIGAVCSAPGHKLPTEVHNKPAVEYHGLLEADCIFIAGSQTIRQLYDRENADQRIITFCGSVDGVLGGGIARGQLTEICVRPYNIVYLRGFFGSMGCCGSTANSMACC